MCPSTSTTSISGSERWLTGSIHIAGQSPWPSGSRIRVSTRPYRNPNRGGFDSRSVLRPVVTMPEVKG